VEHVVNVKYIVELNPSEREFLLDLVSKGISSARKLKRVNILLMADRRNHQDIHIAEALSASTSTVFRTKRAFVEDGLEAALNKDERPGGQRLLSGTEEALLVSLACSDAPEGRCRWTLQLLADRLVTLTELDNVSISTIRRRLIDNELKPWQKKMWCIPKFDAAYIAQMEEVLDLYAEPADPMMPVVNFDEAMKHMVADTREPIPAKPGQTAKQDYEYRRVGTANIYMFFDRHQGWRKTKVTERKTAEDFAECMRDLVDVHYPNAKKIRLVLDNLNTHNAVSLYKTYPPEEARRILRKIEFHYTPKHASWLNMVEIEIGNMNQQCLDRRIPDWGMLKNELAAWESVRNNEKATIKWMFDLDKARTKLTRAYDVLNRS
jgi:transposase